VSNQSAGYSGGISLDQYLARKIGTDTKFPSLEFGVCTTTDFGVLPFSRMISAGPNMPVPSENDPGAMFTRIFSDGNGTSGVIDKAHAQRRSILDFVRDDLTRVGGLVGANDKKKIDSHLTAVRDLESRLARPTPMVNLSCGMGSFPSMGDPLDKANFPNTTKQMMDLMVLALKCDATRIASLQLSWARSTLIHTWANANKSHHDMSPLRQHARADGRQRLVRQAGGLLRPGPGRRRRGRRHQRARQTRWSGGASDVNDAIIHSFDKRSGCSCWAAAAVRSRPGSTWPWAAQPHQKLLVTLMNAMGVPENQFGDATYGTGPLAGVLA
jgi:hypothetical protein